MTEAIAEFLTTESGAALLARGSAWLAKTRELDPATRAGALSVLDGRERAHRRGWEKADQLFVTSEALAQASSDQIASYHAQCFAGCTTVLDACCGLGRDALALAAAGKHVTAVDTDPARLVFARANARLYGLQERIEFINQDAMTLEGCWEGVFFDPARRDGTGRFSQDAERYRPPLSAVEHFRRRSQIVVAKLSPALPDSLLGELGGECRFLSEEHTCKEACMVWRAGAASESLSTTATLLPAGTTYVQTDDLVPVAERVGTYLLDPDPAILRAGALATLAGRVDAALISGDDAYLTSEKLCHDPGIRRYRVQAVFPYRERVLGRWLRERSVERLVVKKRRYPKEPDAVQKELGIKAGRGRGHEATLVIVAQGKSWLGIVCEPT